MPPSAKCLKRIQKDMMNVQALSLETNGCWVDPQTFDKPEWHVYIQGPVKTVWEKGVFKLKMSFPDNYPFDPIKINFDKGIYHPNVGTGGTICLDIIKKDAWSPSYTLQSVFTSIRSLLCDPNPDSPMNGDSARAYTKDKKAYERKVHETIEKHGKCLPTHKRQTQHSEKPDSKTLDRLKQQECSGAGGAAASSSSAASAANNKTTTANQSSGPGAATTKGASASSTSFFSALSASASGLFGSALGRTGTNPNATTTASAPAASTINNKRTTSKDQTSGGAKQPAAKKRKRSGSAGSPKRTSSKQGGSAGNSSAAGASSSAAAVPPPAPNAANRAPPAGGNDVIILSDSD
ncbi:unnamed protein product [Amoebophrya sp. A120]|nr:unnamed protein product [Amoebophrya sp. A120]|eukprot:GSA120T00003924001.1